MDELKSKLDTAKKRINELCNRFKEMFQNFVTQ